MEDSKKQRVYDRWRKGEVQYVLSFPANKHELIDQLHNSLVAATIAFGEAK